MYSKIPVIRKPTGLFIWHGNFGLIIIRYHGKLLYQQKSGLVGGINKINKLSNYQSITDI